MSAALIVQARMTSTRLPGKVLMPVLGKPLLAYQLERLQRCEKVDQIWIATTTNATDEPVVALAAAFSIPVYRGSEADVLSRYADAAQQAQASTIVRVTADCPLIDPGVIDQVIARFQQSDAPDYASNTLARTYPRGLDVEVFSAQGLAMAHAEATEPSHREHVTPFFYTQSERFRLANVESGQDWGHYRWTVDTPEDFELVRRILEAIYLDHPQFTTQDVIQVLEQHPDWMALNAHIEQVRVR